MASPSEVKIAVLILIRQESEASGKQNIIIYSTHVVDTSGH